MPRPLHRNWFLVLLALADIERHGQGISREVLRLSGGQVRLWPATLYSTLDALCREGLIEELGSERRPPDTSEKRRYYHLVERGRRRLSIEARELERLAGEALKRTVEVGR